MSNQPAMTSDKGVICTIGIDTQAGDRTACVFPFATDDGALDFNTLCTDCVLAIQTSILPPLLDCISQDSFVRYIQVEGMMDGMVPSRIDFAAGAFPGTRAHSSIASQVAALVAFYGDPADLGPGVPMRVGKMFLAGISINDVTNDIIQAGLKAALETLASALQSGFATDGGGGKWYRVLARTVVRNVATAVRRTIGGIVRDYVATQRRRLIPRA